MAKPVVDRLETQLQDQARVIRLNALSQPGQQAAVRYSVRGMPTVLVIDGQGQAVYRQVGLIRPGPIVEQVNALLSPANKTREQFTKE